MKGFHIKGNLAPAESEEHLVASYSPNNFYIPCLVSVITKDGSNWGKSGLTAKLKFELGNYVIERPLQLYRNDPYNVDKYSCIVYTVQELEFSAFTKLKIEIKNNSLNMQNYYLIINYF